MSSITIKDLAGPHLPVELAETKIVSYDDNEPWLSVATIEVRFGRKVIIGIVNMPRSVGRDIDATYVKRLIVVKNDKVTRITPFNPQTSYPFRTVTTTT